MADTDRRIPALTQTRHHFKILDGLRGVAAIAVVTFHFMEMAIPDYSNILIGHGFLAVDFFFCLSGFVIGYAYDDRIASMGLWQFTKGRLIRLHPLVVLGSILGLIALYANPLAPVAYSPGKVALIFLASVLLIPYGAMAERGFNNFSLNAPAWSLFWEYIANLLYATVLFRFRRNSLLVLTLLAGVLLCLIGFHAHRLSGGWSSRNFWDGGARVLYSFLAGLLVFRSRWILRSRAGFLSLSILLLLTLTMPYAHGGWIREAVVILFYFPLLIALGAGATLSPRLEKLCTLSGDISYPLYMTHYAVIWIFGDFYERYHPTLPQLHLIVALGVVVMFAFAYLVMRLYDIPVRRYLRTSAETRPTPQLQ